MFLLRKGCWLVKRLICLDDLVIIYLAIYILVQTLIADTT